MNVTFFVRGRRASRSWPIMTCSGASQYVRVLVLSTPGGKSASQLCPMGWHGARKP